MKTVRAMTVKQSDALFFFRKAQRSVPAIEKQIDLSGVTLIHAHTLFTDGSIAERLAKSAACRMSSRCDTAIFR